MPKFKIGDRVRYTAYHLLNDFGTITHIERKYNPLYYVKWDGNRHYEPYESYNHYDEKELVLLEDGNNILKEYINKEKKDESK